MGAHALARQVCRQVAQECTIDELRRPLSSAGTIANVERLARCDKRFAIAIDEFDRDHWLLNTPGGTVDLKTGLMREHRRPDYMTKVTAVTPGGTCPLWCTFIDQITGQDPELAGFIQRMLGYALTGSTQAQCLFFLFGRGANGKSVLLNTVSSILGDGYHTTAAIETFTTSASDRHPTKLAGLRGARLVTAIETEERGKLIEELASVGVKRKLTQADLKAALSGIGARLRTLHSDVLQESIPDRIAELLRQLDEPTQR